MADEGVANHYQVLEELGRKSHPTHFHIQPQEELWRGKLKR